MLTALGGLAEFERELIKARTGEGRARAKADGVHMGRPPKLTPHQRREAIARRDAGEALTDIARTYGVSHTTIGRLTASPALSVEVLVDERSGRFHLDAFEQRLCVLITDELTCLAVTGKSSFSQYLFCHRHWPIPAVYPMAELGRAMATATKYTVRLARSQAPGCLLR